MKKSNLTSLIIPLVLLLLFSCKKDPEYYLVLKPSFYPSVPRSSGGYDSEIGIPGVTVKVFNTELDYKLNRNPAYEGITNSNGEFRVKVPEGYSNYWVRARKDTLTELRYKFNESNNKYGTQTEGKNHIILNKQIIYLSNNPIRLELQLLNLDKTYADITFARIYESENDYLNDVIRYGKPNVVFQRYVDSTESILFNNLEPRRQYWFRVENFNRTNANSVFKTDGPLEDNPDITNVLTVGLE